MRIGAFEIEEPLPELKDPHVFTMLHPWVDVGSVGTLSMARLERHYRAKPLGQLSRPGTFFDFTRYRPTVGTVNGRREITVPNTFLHYARGDRDYLFLHMLEPHMFAEDYIDSILEVLRKFNAKRMVRIGSMYDAVPHTRPLQVSGTISGQNAPQSGMQPSTYQGADLDRLPAIGTGPGPGARYGEPHGPPPPLHGPGGGLFRGRPSPRGASPHVQPP